MDLNKETYDVIVVGGGLAGLVTAISSVDNGSNVILLEKQSKTGGNSAKATSGINGCGTEVQHAHNVQDSLQSFLHDSKISFYSQSNGSTDKLHGEGGDGMRERVKGEGEGEDLLEVLCKESGEAIEWLSAERFGIPLTVLVKLGGHSVKRTHKCPVDANGRPVPVGFFITNTLLKYCQTLGEEKVKIVTNANVVELMKDENKVVGVKYVDTQSQEEKFVIGKNTVLCTGGFGFDRSNDGFMSKYRPDLLQFSTTNGEWATGDGMKLASTVGGNLVDMEKVQLHPTGFVDPKNPTSGTKFLAPEALRGCGAVLLNHKGERFVDELDLRNVVSRAIIENCEGGVAYCVLSQDAQEEFGVATLDFYHKRLGLFEAFPTLEALADIFQKPPSTLLSELKTPLRQRNAGNENKNKIQHDQDNFLNLLVAKVTPVVHYTMGGVQFTSYCQVLSSSEMGKNSSRDIILGLYAVGEVTGGLHGDNRLGGNSLLECVVFGRRAGKFTASSL